MRRSLMLVALSSFALATAAACSSAEKKPDQAETQAAQQKKKQEAEKKKQAPTTLAAAEPSEGALPPSVGPIYFGFDSAELLPEGRASLDKMGVYLAKNPGAQVVLEGHCDDRGTEEYNLALGQRRADVMRDYLTRLGVKKSQLRATSYGELKPVVDGEHEDAWAQNRRGELKLEGTGKS